jgi:hypothetical protein
LRYTEQAFHELAAANPQGELSESFNVLWDDAPPAVPELYSLQ